MNSLFWMIKKTEIHIGNIRWDKRVRLHVCIKFGRYCYMVSFHKISLYIKPFPDTVCSFPHRHIFVLLSEGVRE